MRNLAAEGEAAAVKHLIVLLLGAALAAGCAAPTPTAESSSIPPDDQVPPEVSLPARPKVTGSKDYEPPNHVFRASFAAPPRVQAQPESVMAIDRDHGMLITWTSLPREATLNESTVKEIIKREEARSGVKFTSHKLTKFKSHPALVTHATLNPQQSFDTTYALAGSNLYTITLFHAPSTKGFAREQEAFLKSIELRPPTQAADLLSTPAVERVKP